MLSGNSLRQTAHTHCASVHQAAKLVAALLRVVGVTAGLAAYHRVYDSRHLQADCQELGSSPEPTLDNRLWATFTFLVMEQERIYFLLLNCSLFIALTDDT